MNISGFLKRRIVFPAKNGEFFELPNKKIYDDNLHLKLAIEWLCDAQDATGVGGVAAYYNLLNNKYGVPYRETTGYIIPTFIENSKLTGDKKFFERAVRMGEWEVQNQHESGGIGEVMKDGSVQLKVFNTGQVMLGWCALWDETKNKKYMDATIRAANWLVDIQSENGEWVKFSNSGANVIDSRVAWTLLEVWKRTANARYKESAQKFLDWAVSQQLENGWFKNCSLRNSDKPWMHFIAYTISGLREAAHILQDEKLFQEAILPAKKIMEYYNSLPGHKYLPGTFDKDWGSADKYTCISGNAQMAVEWIKIYQQTKEVQFYESACNMIEQLKGLQIIGSDRKEIRGSLAGSHPVSGDYAAYTIPNWGIKFFADALILKPGRKAGLIG